MLLDQMFGFPTLGEFNLVIWQATSDLNSWEQIKKEKHAKIHPVLTCIGKNGPCCIYASDLGLDQRSHTRGVRTWLLRLNILHQERQ